MLEPDQVMRKRNLEPEPGKRPAGHMETKESWGGGGGQAARKSRKERGCH